MTKPLVKEINGFEYMLYEKKTYEPAVALQHSRDYYQWLDRRRTVRDFSDRPVPRELIENLILSASSAPSGAHKQPWRFCAVSNPGIKKEIRKAAEKEEYESYHGRMSERWLKDLQALGTDWHKPFLEIAPWLIIVFKKAYEWGEKGEKTNNYYVNESVGLAAGFLLTAIHNAGLVALTHTPSPMNFLVKILNRPDNERPFLLIPVGYPAKDVYVPRLQRRPLEEISEFYE
ncbi:MAG: nitroreductase family protein [Cytophagales bacterium]|nr:nitroreductase family protein [Cytophagales bacterium]